MMFVTINQSMGYDIYVYFVANQDEIEEFINSNKIDRNVSTQQKLVSNYYKEQHPELTYVNYSWDKINQIHEFYDSYRTNFIRDDERFSDEQYHKMFQEKYQRQFPWCLQFLHTSLETGEDAIEIANELTICFKEDENECFMHFANWLRETSKKCIRYEFSC